MFRFDGRPDDKPVPRDICAESSQSKGAPVLVKRAGTDLNCKHGFHLDQGKTRHDAFRSGLVQDALDVIRAWFLVVELGRSAGVEEEAGQSAFFA